MNKRKAKYYVYIVKCSRGIYYTGHTTDLEGRIKSHTKGTGAKYLRGKSSIKLVYAKEYGYYKNALRAERKIKKLRRKRKEELVRIYEKSCPQIHE